MRWGVSYPYLSTRRVLETKIGRTTAGSKVCEVHGKDLISVLFLLTTLVSKEINATLG
jgi:hypothetical protein